MVFRAHRKNQREWWGRVAIALASAGVASTMPVAAQVSSSQESLRAADQALVKLVDGGIAGPVAGVSIVVSVDGQTIYTGQAGCAEIANTKTGRCKRRMTANTKVRVASISKMALAMGVHALVDAGKLDLSTDVSDYLGWSLRNPAYADQPITTGQLLSHVGTIRDPAQYWVLAPGTIEDLFADDAAAPFAQAGSGDRAPGTYFTYANLNSGLLATVMEGATGTRFDQLMEETVFAPLGLDVGYNWFGVSRGATRRGGVLYRWIDDQWQVQKDSNRDRQRLGANLLSRDRVRPARYLKTYEPGTNGSIFSPQGGLRASARDLSILVRAMRRYAPMQAPTWQLNATQTNGQSEENYFTGYGLGTQTVTGTPTFYPDTVFTGHPGEAYGLYSGAWDVKTTSDGSESKATIAFVITGTVPDVAPSDHPSFNAAEAHVMKAAMALITAKKREGQQHHAGDDEPRPYDPSRNAMADIDATLALAREEGRKTLIVLGANWCHDSRGLAAKFEKPRFKTLLDEHYALVYVDVGKRDRNLDVPKRFDVHGVVGTPNVLILDQNETLLNRSTVSKWRRADSIPDDEAYAYFQAFAAGERWEEPWQRPDKGSVDDPSVAPAEVTPEEKG
ncbi:MAG: serine hydrolase [Pseudomonadota bacterium]